jgi:hypothetical protein
MTAGTVLPVYEDAPEAEPGRPVSVATSDPSPSVKLLDRDTVSAVDRQGKRVVAQPLRRRLDRARHDGPRAFALVAEHWRGLKAGTADDGRGRKKRRDHHQPPALAMPVLRACCSAWRKARAVLWPSTIPVWRL